MATESTSPLFGDDPRNDDERIGRMVSMLLDLLGLKKQDLAGRLGMEPAHLSKKLRGTNAWSANEVRRTAAALGFPVGLLMADPDEVAASLRDPGVTINYRKSA